MKINQKELLEKVESAGYCVEYVYHSTYGELTCLESMLLLRALEHLQDIEKALRDQQKDQ